MSKSTLVQEFNKFDDAEAWAIVGCTLYLQRLPEPESYNRVLRYLADRQLTSLVKQREKVDDLVVRIEKMIASEEKA